MAIESTITTLKMHDVVASLFSMEMQRESIKLTKEALAICGRPKEKGKKKDKKKENNARSKSHGRSKSPRKYKDFCWNYGKPGHFHKECKEEKKKRNNDSDSNKSS